MHVCLWFFPTFFVFVNTMKKEVRKRMQCRKKPENIVLLVVKQYRNKQNIKLCKRWSMLTEALLVGLCTFAELQMQYCGAVSPTLCLPREP